MTTTLLLALLLACGDKDAGDDTGTPGTDGGTTADGGTVTDGGTPGDGGTETDGGTVEAIDADGDGYDEREDCDDSNPAVHPGAPEVCNGIDDDCDDWVDLEDNNLDRSTTTTYYPDGDEDGYGDEDGAQALCDQPDLTVDVGGDCDDSDPAVNPDATEICGDGVDNDCDDTLNDCVLSGERSTDDAILVLEGPAAGALAGTSLGTAWFNDDEYVDFVVAGPGAAGLDGETMGAVWMVHGPVSGTVDLSWADASWSASSADLGASAGLGQHVFAGDANDDGFGDVIVAVPGADAKGAEDAGMVVVLYGPMGSDLGNDVADERAVLTANTAGLGFGMGAQLVDDLTGTGDINLLVGTNGGNALYLYNQAPISAGGTHTATATIFCSTEEEEDIGFGAWFDGRGDVDGDGQVDLVVAAPGLDEVFVVLGPVSGELTLADEEGALSGSGLGLGQDVVQSNADIDGDGHLDLLLGDPDSGRGVDVGAAYLFLGPLTGAFSVDDASLVVTGTELGMALGSSGRIGADLDLDGRPELLLGAPNAADGAGAVYAWIGRTEGSLTTDDADVAFVGASPSMRVGAALGDPVDVDDDGIEDILAGAWQAGDRAGAVYVFSGAAW